MNKVFTTGYLNTKNPIEIKFTTNGKSVISFTVASENYKKKDEKQTYTYVDCVAWGKTAEFVANNQDRVKRVLIDGRLQKRSYEAKDGSKRYITEVVVEKVEVLQWKDDGEQAQANDSLGNMGEDVTEVDSSDIPF